MKTIKIDLIQSKKCPDCFFQSLGTRDRKEASMTDLNLGRYQSTTCIHPYVYMYIVQMYIPTGLHTHILCMHIPTRYTHTHTKIHKHQCGYCIFIQAYNKFIHEVVVMMCTYVSQMCRKYSYT